MSLTTFTLQSATTQAAAPFTLGHVFKQGDVPAGQSVTATGAAAFQCLAKSAWPDGSLKFAVLSGTASLTASTPLTITLDAGSAAGGTALTTTDLKNTGVTASVACTAFGTVSWATTDWDTPFQTWCSGPSMSSWIYRKAVGSDAHLVAWLEVRLYAGGQVEVLPWIENGYLQVASPTNKSDTYAFSLGGSQRVSVVIDLKHHTRTPLINGSELSYWLGSDPGVTPKHNAAYMQATEQVPTYRANVSPSAAIVTALPSTYAPLQEGSLHFTSDDMSSPGYQAPIGLLPEHDVLYLTTTADTYASVIRNGYSAGRYAIHYRDETTNLPPLFSAYPTLVIRSSQGIKDGGASSTNSYTPVMTGGNPPGWDTAHCPSVGYMAYLLTGRWYFMEECQFAATAIHFSVTDEARAGKQWHSAISNWDQVSTTAYATSDGIVTTSVQLRAGAWNLRTLAQALSVTPSTHPLFTNLKNSVEKTIDYYHDVYVAQTSNQFGFVFDNLSYHTIPPNNFHDGSPWMMDFFTMAWGYMAAMGLPVSSTMKAKSDAFFAWTAKSAIGRLGTSADFWYVNAAPYALAKGSGDPTNYFAAFGTTGPWYASWAAIYAATYGTGYESATLSNTEGVLSSELWPEGSGGNQPSTFSNLHPAIAYAVRHGVTGASAAYARMTGASNYSSLTSGFDANPVWSVTPASIPSGSTGVGDTLRIDTTDLIASSLVIGDTGLGVLGSLIRANTATGTNGPGALYNDWDDSSDDNKEFRAQLLTAPSAGTLFMNEDGSFSFTGAPDGSYSFTYRLWVDGVDSGTATVNMTIGSSTTPVTTDLASSFNVRSIVQQNLAANFNVRALVTSDSASQFAVLALTQADLPSAFSVHANVQADSPSAFSIRTNVQADSASSFNTLTSLTANSASNFSVLNSAVSNLASSFNVLARVTSDCFSTFNVDGAIIVTPVITDLASNYAIRSIVSRDVTTYFNIGDNPLAPTGGFSAKYKHGTRIRKVYRTQLPTIDPSESVLVEFDFSDEAAAISNPRFEVSVYRGEDANPQNIIVGSVIVSGAKAYQRFTGGLSKVQYGILCVAETNDGDTLAAPAILPVKNKLAH